MASERNWRRKCSGRGSMESSEKRRRKCCSSSSSPQGGDVCAIDRISDLPESIISYILSFLPMKSVLATSILSKTWKFYWTKVTTFDFDDDDPKSRNMDFVEFVNMVLVEQTYESIQKFRLHLHHSHNLMPRNLRLWTDTAISRNVRVLDFDLSRNVLDEKFCLPDALYTCRTLEVLILRGRILVSVADVAVSLPKLSELELIDVSYESNESLPKLIAGCPVLEKLRLHPKNSRKIMESDLKKWSLIVITRNVRVLDLYIELKICLPNALYTCRTLEVLKLRGRILVSVADVAVSLPKLSELELIDVSYESNESLPKLIAGCPVLKKLTNWFPDEEYNMTICSISSASLKHLQLYFKRWGDAMKVEIDAPALEQLYINDQGSRQISIHNPLTQLDKGYLDVVKIAELLQAFHRAKTLRLNGDTMTAISNATNELSVNFERLTSLYMNIKRRGWKCLVDLLDCCIKLQFMFIRCGGESDEIKWTDLVHIPRCLSSSLRFLAFKSFSGSEEEMVLLKFILHHGLVMERVYLWYPRSKL